MWLVCVILIGQVASREHCTPLTHFLRYYKIRDCHKSTLPVIALGNVEDLASCKNLAREKRGLAFNYSPPNAVKASTRYVINCQIMGCPEHNSSALVPDITFDYYSAFGNLTVIENATCIKSVGLFDLIQEKLDYTGAINYCQYIGADLADILGDFRTNTLANLLQSIDGWYKAAYVGLSDIEMEGTFQTPMGLLLSCTKFRAWSPGHPRQKHKEREDCVVLDASRTWRVINCNNKLPFVCEFFPGMPQLDANSTDLAIVDVNCTTINNRQRKRKCLGRKSLFELYNNSSRVDQCALVDVNLQ